MLRRCFYRAFIVVSLCGFLWPIYAQDFGEISIEILTEEMCVNKCISIETDTRWFEHEGFENIRIEIISLVDSAYCWHAELKKGSGSVLWNPPASGDYELVLQMKKGGDWKRTDYARRLKVDDIVMAISEETFIDIVPNGGEITEDNTTIFGFDSRVQSGDDEGDIVNRLIILCSETGVVATNEVEVRAESYEWKPDAYGLYHLEWQVVSNNIVVSSIEKDLVYRGVRNLSDEDSLDICKFNGVRYSSETILAYSSQWDGGEGATVTIAQDGVVITEGLSGEGEQPWRVQRTGEYTLTHTTYTNGVVGKVETAMFVVPGPKLTFEYDGGSFVGGTVTINGNIDGWTIYYTLDGSTPTTESLKYTGPFTLSVAAILKAFAVSESGMSTPIYENDYAVAEFARIDNVQARQRYPWNGLVDVKCVLKGNSEQNYNILFLVNDEAGGTNIPARTFWQVGGNTTNNVLTVKPGNLHFVWDANTDIVGDGEFSGVSITVKAEVAEEMAQERN
jgi:hypothetical protein